MALFLNFEETENSKIFNNSDFGYWKITILRPLKDEKGKLKLDKKGNTQADKELTDTEQIPLNYEGGIEAFFRKEVLPYAPDAWIDETKTQIGYEISFTKHFYKPVQLRTLSEITADIRALEAETDGLLNNILND
jgi:type I restriction enzyme M protein